MKRILMLLLIISVLGCKAPSKDHADELLDSLKREYAGKTVHVTFTNNEAGTAPISSQYAYVDRSGSDLAFELNPLENYRVAFEEGVPFVPTTDKVKEDKPDMILIEIPNTGKQGFVSYRVIKEFSSAWVN